MRQSRKRNVDNESGSLDAFLSQYDVPQKVKDRLQYLQITTLIEFAHYAYTIQELDRDIIAHIGTEDETEEALIRTKTRIAWAKCQKIINQVTVPHAQRLEVINPETELKMQMWNQYKWVYIFFVGSFLIVPLIMAWSMLFPLIEKHNPIYRYFRHLKPPTYLLSSLLDSFMNTFAFHYNAHQPLLGEEL